MNTQEIRKNMEAQFTGPMFKSVSTTCINTLKKIDSGEYTPQQVINRIDELLDQMEKPLMTSIDMVYNHVKNELKRAIKNQ